MKDAVEREEVRTRLANCETKFDKSKIAVDRVDRLIAAKREQAVELEDLARGSGEWLKGSGPESDIVISSRIRLARNLADFPFISRANTADRSEIERILRDRIMQLRETTDLVYRRCQQAREHRPPVPGRAPIDEPRTGRSPGRTGVAIDPKEQVSLMINEEDHLRIQVMQSGLDLQNAWEKINRIDDLIEAQVTYAFSDRLGYLTACPTNVGTGMRVSVMLHLPALVITRQIDKLFRSLQKISLAVRGLYGEGSQAMGDFYQISNQITLGRSEADLVKQVATSCPRSSTTSAKPASSWCAKPGKPARPGQPGIRHPAHRPDDQLRRNHALAIERADGRQPGV